VYEYVRNGIVLNGGENVLVWMDEEWTNE